MFSLWDSLVGKDTESTETKDNSDEDTHNTHTDVGDENTIEGENGKLPESDSKPKDATETAKDLAKNVGSFLYSFASVASQTAVKVKDTVKETVEGKAILGDFSKEQEKFVNEKRSKCKETGVPPWVGYHEEESMKLQILALSSDERNFLRDPPSGVQFIYDYDSMFPVALATLEEDPELKTMRFNLVPKKVKETVFWRNYFYRVSLIKQSSQLTSLAASTNGKGGSSTGNKASSELSSKGFSHSEQQEIPKKTITPNNSNDDVADMGALSSSPTHEEFISDAFDGAQELSKEDLEQIGVERLTLSEKSDKKQPTTSTRPAATAIKQSDASKSENTETEKKVAPSDIPDWERELQEELNEYDVVVNEENENDDDDDGSWEKEIEDMLESEEP